MTEIIRNVQRKKVSSLLALIGAGLIVLSVPKIIESKNGSFKLYAGCAELVCGIGMLSYYQYKRLAETYNGGR